MKQYDGILREQGCPGRLRLEAEWCLFRREVGQLFRLQSGVRGLSAPPGVPFGAIRSIEREFKEENLSDRMTQCFISLSVYLQELSPVCPGQGGLSMRFSSLWSKVKERTAHPLPLTYWGVLGRF